MSEPTEKKQSHLWQPGQSGNANGRPRGSRHAALKALDLIGHDGAADTLRKVVEQAKGGDLRAAEILLRRVWPEPKGRAVSLDLPPMRAAADLVAALATITEAVGIGDITPDEGHALASVVEVQRRAIETVALEQRIADLEAKAST